MKGGRASDHAGRRRCRLLVLAFAAAVALAPFPGCGAPPPLPPPVAHPLPGPSNYSYAVYDNDDALLHSPLDALAREMADRARRGAPALTDLFVLVHGWDFTIEEAFALYEGYRATLEQRLPDLKRGDPDFEPFFLFVTWSSVTRPISNVLRSVLPFPPPDLAESAAHVADGLAFHVPSAWGESQDAMRLALGPPLRWMQLDPQADPGAEYARAIEAGYQRIGGAGFEGFEVPVSLLLEQMIRLRQESATAGGEPTLALHVLGHSFGGKLASLAAFDAVQRTTARELVRGEPLRDDDLIDSLVLICPALQASELYYELPLPFDPAVTQAPASAFRRGRLSSAPSLRFDVASRRIGTKALIYSKHDSANGWVFGLGDLLMDHDAAARAQRMLARAHERPLPPPRTVGQRLLTLPFDLADRTLQVAVRGGAILTQTLLSDAGAVIDGFVEAAVEIGDESPNPGAVAIDLLKLPFAPLLAQRSLGNRGLDRPRSTLGWLDSREWLFADSWLDDVACAYLEASQRVDADDLLAQSVTLGTPPSVEGEAWLACDARKLFTGPEPAFLASIVPPGAHGDLRSNALLRGPGSIELSKRVRSMNVLYNLTRGGRLSRHGHAALRPRPVPGGGPP